MPVSTQFCECPWSKDELAALHGCNGSRAIRKQETLDELIVEILAPAYVRRGTRADQAAASIAATVARLHRLFEGDPEGAKRHVTHLVKIAYDRSVNDRVDTIGRQSRMRIAEARQRKRGRATA